MSLTSEIDSLHKKLALQKNESKKLRGVLIRIAKLDPEKDSKNGFNEWGEAECFQKAQEMAKKAVKFYLKTPRRQQDNAT